MPHKRKYPIGKYKCYKCQQLLILDSDNFYCSKTSHNGFSSMCRQCLLKKFKTLPRKKTHKSSKAKIVKILGKKCNVCGLEKDLDGFFDLDHIKPLLSRTRNNPTRKDLPNLQVLCPNCHRLKTIKEGTERGWWKKRGVNVCQT